MSPLPRLRTLAASAAAGCALVAAAFPAGASAIVKGYTAGEGDYPWTVALVTHGKTPDSGQFCGGTLISRTEVLTAAHCIIDQTSHNVATADAIDVLFGQTNLLAPAGAGGNVGQRISVASISMHPLADTTKDRYDVALLTLKDPVDSVSSTLDNAIVSPVDDSGANTTDTLVDSPTSSTLLPQISGTPGAWGPGTDTYVFGWGTQHYNTNSYASVLRFTGGPNLERLADTRCNAAYGSAFSSDDMLCAGRTNPNSVTRDALGHPTAEVEDACQGDSGGPLLKKAAQDDFTQNDINAYRASFPPDAQPSDPQIRSEFASRQVRNMRSYGREWRLVGVVSFGDGCGDIDHPGVYARVGAPVIRDYIQQANPPSTPILDPGQPPAITGSYGLSQQITCNPGTWQNATSISSVLWRDTDGNGSRSANETFTGQTTGATAQYVVQAKDLTVATSATTPINCSVTARGPGGYQTTQASAMLPVVQPGPGGVDPGKPVPTTPAVVVDKVGPTISRSSAVCASTSCRVSVIVLDPEHGAAGVKKVTVTLVKTRKLYYRVTSGTDRGKVRHRTVKIREQLKLKKAGDTWTVVAKGLKKSDVSALVFAATDAAGNPGRLKVALKLRGR